jgi:hypothetical protein
MTGKKLDVEGLRTMTPSMVDVSARGALSSHVDMMEPRLIADLYALDELDLKSQFGQILRQFVARASHELVSMSDTRTEHLVSDVADIPPAQVPARLRAVLGRLAAFDVLAATWAATSPEVVRLAVPVPVARAAAPKGRAVTPEQAKAKRTYQAAPDAEPEKKKGETATKAVRAPKVVVEDTRAADIRADVLARVITLSDGGLNENLLVGGVQRRLEPVYPGLQPDQIMAVLRTLSREGLLKYRSGRWYRAGR